MAHYQRTATTITSAGKRKPANAERGGDHRRDLAAWFTGQGCLDLPIDERNGAGWFSPSSSSATCMASASVTRAPLRSC
jgi:hypothetical protein